MHIDLNVFLFLCHHFYCNFLVIFLLSFNVIHYVISFCNYYSSYHFRRSKCFFFISVSPVAEFRRQHHARVCWQSAHPLRPMSSLGVHCMGVHCVAVHSVSMHIVGANGVSVLSTDVNDMTMLGVGWHGVVVHAFKTFIIR